MYVNQIDNIIDQILDNLYLQGLSNDPTFKTITEGKKINYVEYREQINLFIQKFIDNIDTTSIQRIISNKENLKRIMDIIKRYVAYYYFLSLAYYYAGTMKDFRNNLIQYSKLQENSSFTIKNFFDTENNYQIITFYKIIKDSIRLLTMTDLQKKTIDPLEVKDAIQFLNGLGKDYVDNFLLTIKKIDGINSGNSENGENEGIVEVNAHNLIKTIVFREIYRNQDQTKVFNILSDSEESKNEYTYIDIIVPTNEAFDFETFKQIFVGDEVSGSETLALDLFELVQETNKPFLVPNADKKNNLLLGFSFITPVVDDFLRYHRDSERLEAESDKAFKLPLMTSTNNAKNIQMALIYQQRKKKENTKAQLIVNKIDAISDLYSDNVKNNAELVKDIKRYFQNPLSHRKAVTINYLDEVRVMNKIINLGLRAIEGNEYFLELLNINSHAYFNFKDFQKYGTSLNLERDTPKNMIRYSNIESINQLPTQEVDNHTASNDMMINMVGLSLGPFLNGPLQCIKKENMVDIRTITIEYPGKKTTKKKFQSDNGYKIFLKVLKHFYINTISIKFHPKIALYHDFESIKNLNKNLMSKIIYWIYDIDKDIFLMETYENMKSQNFQENIKFMNAKVYDEIVEMLVARLIHLMNNNTQLSVHDMESLIEIFSDENGLLFRLEDKQKLFIEHYLQKKVLGPSNIIEIPADEIISMPTYKPEIDLSTFVIRIDTINPQNPQEYKKLESYTAEKMNITDFKNNNLCQHDSEWKEISKLKKTVTLNKYNAAVTQFIEKFAIETVEYEFVCKVCSKILPMKRYVQDGKFDTQTQKFVSAYLPLDLPLEDIKEYSKYNYTIRFLDNLINRMSLITGTNMLVGTNTQVRLKRKNMIKSIIDIIVKHNQINLKKNISDDERAEFNAKKFNIDKDLDSIFFFELNDSIFNFTDVEPSVADLNRLKFNNILIYFILIFITEFNGIQIIMTNKDKIANIYTFLKYGPKIFSNLLIKKAINDMETRPITEYPVLCYLLFLISYFLIKYKLWFYPSASTKTFNPIIQKVIANSFVDLFNSISMDAGKNLTDYVYMVTTSNLYTQLNTTFKNNDIINLLKKAHIRYGDSSDLSKDIIVPPAEVIPTYSIAKPIKTILPTRKIPDFKVVNGIVFDRRDHVMYEIYPYNNDITNCDDGKFHQWIGRGTTYIDMQCGSPITVDPLALSRDPTLDNYYYILNKIANVRCLDGKLHEFVEKDGKMICSLCGKEQNIRYTRDELNKLATVLPIIYIDQVDGTINETTSNYYYNLNKIANRRCLDGKFHEFVGKKGKFMCLLCGREKDIQYTKEDLEKLADNLMELDDNRIKDTLKNIAEQNKELENIQEIRNSMMKELINNYRKDNNDKLYGRMNAIADKLISIFEEYMGANTNVEEDKYPIRLRDNIYVIDHAYDGSPFTEPFTFTESDNKILFKENHPFFKTDVYYYTDNRSSPIDVFYHAVTLKLIGYKEKHKEYVLVKKTNNYLVISQSIKNRLLNLGYVTKYIDITDTFDKNSKTIKNENDNMYQILDNLIREHIIKLRLSVDKIVAILNKVKNYQPEELQTFLQSAQTVDRMISKYGKLIKDLKLGSNDNAFNDWQDIRNSFSYQKVNWKETNIKINQTNDNKFINAEIINFYDTSSNVMLFYLVNNLIDIIDSNKEKITKINIIQLIIDIIDYIYKNYNVDNIKNLIEYKRFKYILDGSDVMIDLLRKGQGLDQSKELENTIEELAAEEEIPELVPTEEEKEELEDLREEVEALDVEGDYYAEEEGDYVETGDYEEA